MYSLDVGQLSDEQTTGLITLIPKKDQDRTEIANWRPIMLLNIDFKITKHWQNAYNPVLKR